MQIRHLRLFLAALGLGLALSSCATRANYINPLGPRYAADHTVAARAARAAPATAPPSHAVALAAGPRTAHTVKAVSYNVRYGEDVEGAIEVLTRSGLVDADLFLLQEMNRPGVDRIARALRCRYVYYPASHRKSGRDFGNAILTRGTIVDDEKVLLPGVNPYNRQRRIGVRTGVELGGRRLDVYSVHTETPFLGLEERALQIETLLDSVPGESAACLIAGDLNTMSTRSLRRFEALFASEGFERASVSAGDTFGLGPFGFETDHVFVRGMRPLDAGKVDVDGVSDHEPLWVELELQPGLPDTSAPPVATGGSVMERTRALATFPEEKTPIRDWMKRNGWKSKRHDPKRFELGEGRLHLVSDDNSVLIGTDKGLPEHPESWPRLRFRLKVDRVPEGTDLARKKGDDAAFRIYLAFDRGGGWFSPPDTIAYTWTEDLEPETVVQSAHYDRVKYLSVGRGVTTGADTDGWVTIERDVLADYRRLFPDAKEVPDFAGFMLKCDTNNTGSRASAWLERLELVAAE